MMSGLNEIKIEDLLGRVSRNVTIGHLLSCLEKYDKRRRIPVITSPDNLTRVDVDMYDGVFHYDEHDPSMGYEGLSLREKIAYSFYTKKVSVPLFFKEEAESISFQKFDRELPRYKSQLRLHDMKNTTYKWGYLPSALKMLIRKEHRHRCKLCGRSAHQLEKNQSLELDHIIERWEGGENEYRNIQVLCSECNKAKHHYKKNCL